MQRPPLASSPVPSTMTNQSMTGGSWEKWTTISPAPQLLKRYICSGYLGITVTIHIVDTNGCQQERLTLFSFFQFHMHTNFWSGDGAKEMVEDRKRKIFVVNQLHGRAILVVRNPFEALPSYFILR